MQPASAPSPTEAYAGQGQRTTAMLLFEQIVRKDMFNKLRQQGANLQVAEPFP